MHIDNQRKLIEEKQQIKLLQSAGIKVEVDCTSDKKSIKSGGDPTPKVNKKKRFNMASFQNHNFKTKPQDMKAIIFPASMPVDSVVDILDRQDKL
jgi:hypothetical protein